MAFVPRYVIGLSVPTLKSKKNAKLIVYSADFHASLCVRFSTHKKLVNAQSEIKRDPADMGHGDILTKNNGAIQL